MRKTIVFGAIAALLGLAAAAQASNDDAKTGMKDDSHITRQTETVGRSDEAEHEAHERAEYRKRDDDSREHGNEADEREHRSGAYEDDD
jgi:hypothetical protein